jgi:hypothetical protein
MIRYTSEQRVFLYDTQGKYESARKRRRTFCDEKISSRKTIHRLENKLETTEIFNRQEHKRRLLTYEKLDDIGARLTPRK